MERTRQDAAKEWWKSYRWVAPKRCPCTGKKNSHGFGAYCAAWESKLDPEQTPWCYTTDSCPLARAKGSFGMKYLSCKRAGPARSSGGGIWPFSGRRLAAGGNAAAQSRKSRHRAAEEKLRDDLLRKARRSGKFYMLLSAKTQTNVRVELPPAENAMIAHASRSDSFAASAIFAQMPQGRILAIGTNAYLTLCKPGPAAFRFDGANEPEAHADSWPRVCSAVEKRDENMMLLRRPLGNATEFFVQQLGRAS